METEKIEDQIYDSSKLNSEEMGCLEDILKELGILYYKDKSLKKEDLQWNLVKKIILILLINQNQN